jgi:hypothetical protein
MRLVMVNAPEGRGQDIARIAFSVDINKVSHRQVTSQLADGKTETKDVVDVETSTPKAKHYIDAILAADFYDKENMTISVRSPVSIISRENLREITKPLTETVTDIFEELFQFSHITYSFVGRVFIAASLLAYGMIRQQLLIMIAGLLFLPLLPLLQAIGFGAWTRQWKLSLQGLLAFLLAMILLVLGGVVVASLSDPPLRFDEFSSLGVGFLISLVVGIAAGLAIIDDAGKREMIGLAATAQIAIVPVWFGICLVFGFPATTSESQISSRALSLLVNVVTLIVASLAVHVLSGAASKSLSRVQD